jgi:RTX calcium-binding nonapeptide repeat (4 copies)
VVVRASKRVAAELFLDFRYGRLQPGATDEGDGASEIEIDVDLGGGLVAVRAIRGVDHISVGEAAGSNAVNLNAGEASPDIDVLAGGRDVFAIHGGGSSDRLITTEASPFTGAPDFFSLQGGQGDDVLTGGAGSDGFFGGGGSDQVEAGPGPDFVFVSGQARDQIDCGPGRDFVLLLGRGRHDFRECEEKLDPREETEVFKRRPRTARAAGMTLAAKLKTPGSKVMAPPLRRWTVGAPRR